MTTIVRSSLLSKQRFVNCCHVVNIKSGVREERYPVHLTRHETLLLLMLCTICKQRWKASSSLRVRSPCFTYSQQPQHRNRSFTSVL